jgi:hypothetical protein
VLKYGTEEKMGKFKFTKFNTEPTDMDWLRMATLIDTEGSVKVARKKPYPKSGSKSFTYNLYVQVSNTDPRISYWCLKLFGGYMEVRQPGKHGHKITYVYLCMSKRAEQILDGCLPYFLAKRDQAELALMLRRTVGNTKYCKGGVSPEREIQRASIWKQLSALKHRNFTPEEAKLITDTVQ